MAGETQHRGRPTFATFSRVVSQSAGHSTAFAVALLVIVVWAITGPLFRFSDTWQLVINTGTTIVTFLMVFLIQNTQNRDATAMHLKLDELIRATRGARNVSLDMEELPEAELERLRRAYEALAARARGRAGDVLRTGTPDLETAIDEAGGAAVAGTEARIAGTVAREQHAAARRSRRSDQEQEPRVPRGSEGGNSDGTVGHAP